MNRCTAAVSLSDHSRMTSTVRLALVALAILCTVPARAATVSGSGFVVGSRGEILTTAHIVAGCSRVEIQLSLRRTESAIVVARDLENDLAVVRPEGGSQAGAIFRAGRIRDGDTVIDVPGLHSSASTSQADVSVGSISGLAGLGNDARYLQISGPMQPSNGGGPLLDTSGHVAGIIVRRSDAPRAPEAAGDTPRNVNFALKAEIATAFLDINGIDYRTASSDKHLSPTEIGENARAFMIHIECRPAPPEAGAGADPAPSILPDDTPFERYNYALGLLREGKHAEAEQALHAFLDRYPADALAGNAQYWLGEALYARRDYAKAADAFAGGYQKNPVGPKAPDSLLMLGTALARLGQKADACRALGKLHRDFPGVSADIRERMRTETRRLRC
jgi:tol-pal system protein YbgF